MRKKYDVSEKTNPYRANRITATCTKICPHENATEG